MPNNKEDLPNLRLAPIGAGALALLLKNFGLVALRALTYSLVLTPAIVFMWLFLLTSDPWFSSQVFVISEARESVLAAAMGVFQAIFGLSCVILLIAGRHDEAWSEYWEKQYAKLDAERGGASDGE